MGAGELSAYVVCLRRSHASSSGPRVDLGGHIERSGSISTASAEQVVDGGCHKAAAWP